MEEARYDVFGVSKALGIIDLHAYGDIHLTAPVYPRVTMVQRRDMYAVTTIKFLVHLKPSRTFANSRTPCNLAIRKTM